jgi:hypothetical protein
MAEEQKCAENAAVVKQDDSSIHHKTIDSWSRRLWTWGVEVRGIHPVQESDRTDTQFSKIFFIWFSANFNILSFSAGTLGPVVFGLGVRDACLVILFFNLVCTLPPAYLSVVLSPKYSVH